MGAYFLLYTLLTPPAYPMPSLTGLSVQEAARILAPLHLNIRLQSEQEKNDVPPGTILQHIPTVQQTILPYQTVFLTLSCQTPPEPVPNFYQMPLEKIEEICTQKGWPLKAYYVDSPHPYNQAVAQIPAAGQPPEKQIIVYLAQASKKKMCIMPSLLGYRVPKVLDFLEQHGLHASILHDYPRGSSHHCACTVQDQRPCAGSLVSLDTLETIQIYVG